MYVTTLYPTVQEIIAVSDRGTCDLDLWGVVNRRSQHWTSKGTDESRRNRAVGEIAVRLFRDTIGELRSDHRYIFNLKPSHMLARTFGFENGESILLTSHPIDEPREHGASLQSLFEYLLEILGFE